MKLLFPEKSDGVVRIRIFAEEHLTNTYVSWLNDKDVVRFSEQRHFVHTMESCRAYFSEQVNSLNYFLAIEHLQNGILHVGNMGIAVDVANKTADLSILLGIKSVWRLGLATRAWTMALNTILNELDFRMVTAGTMTANEPMIKLLKRSGMKIDCILPDRFIFEGKTVGLVAASINRDNFKI